MGFLRFNRDNTRDRQSSIAAYLRLLQERQPIYCDSDLGQAQEGVVILEIFEDIVAWRTTFDRRWEMMATKSPTFISGGWFRAHLGQ
jgi:hypothetical protein